MAMGFVDHLGPGFELTTICLTQKYDFSLLKLDHQGYKNAQKPILSIKEALELTPEKVKTSKKTFKSGNIQGMPIFGCGERLC